MGKYRERRRKIKRNRNIAVGVLLLAALSAGGYLYSRAGSNRTQSVGETEKGTAADLRDKILSAARVGQTDLTGLTVMEAEETLNERYQWELIVSDGKDSVLLDNLIEPQLQAIIKQLDPPDQTQQYEIDYEALREPFISQAASLAERWNKSAVNSELESFNKTSGAFVYTKEQNGRVLDQEKLVEQLMEAVKSENYQAEIMAGFKETSPEMTQAQAKEQYEVVGTFTTTTTDNKNRNQNIRLAVDSLNGLILKPGEEFSFNNTTGNRTKEKGYQPAGAYRNGVLIEEPGGGVCQVSTTLYHAIIEVGFKTTERNAHSFAPSYVKKGQDAMVSFDGYAGPDLKFINTSGHTMAVRAALDGKSLKISLVGLPVLEGGVKVTIRSEKVRDLEPMEPVYEEDPSLPYGTEKVVDKGTTGGVYKSYRVYKKGDTVIKEEPLHNSTYKGKPAVINRNTTVPPAETESQTSPETQPQTTEVQENSEIGPGGGGSETTVPETDIPVVPAAE
ncbi:VanW family protein [Lacrimispora sp.]|uniref:VanW family protein n=1 Tax=Lacrimispora sp. TaxID=2719234 RepID=UPI00285D0F20|nr:VanW family protein [Lacrimispora sp.]MDR7813869.1 VanW family protein [Lacrimispora sp.]